MGAQIGQGSGPAAEVLCNGPGLQRAQPYPHVPRLPADGLDEAGKPRLPRQVAAPGGDLDAGEDQLPVALLPQAADLPDGGVQRQGPHRSPCVGDDAVGAEVDTPVFHLQHGAGPCRQAPGGQDLEGPAAEGFVQIYDRLLLVGGLLQQVQKFHPVPGAGDEIHIQPLYVLRVGLGVAAADRYHGAGGLLPGPADLPGFLVADGGDGTGVDDTGVCRALKGNQRVAAGGQLPLHGGGLVLVYLAAKGVDGNVHRPFLLPFQAIYDIIKNYVAAILRSSRFSYR